MSGRDFLTVVGDDRVRWVLSGGANAGRSDDAMRGDGRRFEARRGEGMRGGAMRCDVMRLEYIHEVRAREDAMQGDGCDCCRCRGCVVQTTTPALPQNISHQRQRRGWSALGEYDAMRVSQPSDSYLTQIALTESHFVAVQKVKSATLYVRTVVPFYRKTRAEKSVFSTAHPRWAAGTLEYCEDLICKAILQKGSQPLIPKEGGRDVVTIPYICVR